MDFLNQIKLQIERGDLIFLKKVRYFVKIKHFNPLVFNLSGILDINLKNLMKQLINLKKPLLWIANLQKLISI